MASKKSKGPKRVRVVLDTGPEQKVDPLVLEREHHEHDPEWTQRRKPEPKHRRDTEATFTWGGAAA